MRNHGKRALGLFGLLVALLCSVSGISFAAEKAATPELEAKTERIRTQQAQRVTQAQREAAAAALKAQKEKIQKAREVQQGQSQPTTGEKSAQ